MKPRFPTRSIPGITGLPIATPRLRVGLFGGSLNPPHAGHRLVALECLKRLRLDAVWLLVSPGNPLKSHSELAPLQTRVLSARKLLDHPRLHATGYEAVHGFRFTFDTLRSLQERIGARFVWIMGADNLDQFERWDRWRDIADLMPMAIYARPGQERLALSSGAARALSAFRMDEADAPILADADPPAWVYLRGKTSPLSSSAIRASARKSQG